MSEQHTKGLDKATPGPWMWFTEHKGDSDKPHVKFLKSKVNNQGFAHTVGLSEPQDTANADLIAAAPELLEACKAALIVHEAINQRAVLDHLPESTTVAPLLMKLRAALAKARPDES